MAVFLTYYQVFNAKESLLTRRGSGNVAHSDLLG
jgi:hypothetical protein